MFDPANYPDGTPFVPGDTLVVGAGHLGVAAAAGVTLGAITTGTFVIQETGGADESLIFNNVSLDAGSSITEAGTLRLDWFAQNQFVNNGLIQLGTASDSGNVFYDETATTTTQRSQLTKTTA